MIRRALTVAALLAVIAPIPAHASTYTIEVENVHFAPSFVRAQAGDTLLWTWTSGVHNVTAYSGDDFTSDDQQPPYRFSARFDGGTLLYRCTLHSSVNQAGQCNGMCGAVSDQSIDVLPPTVTIVSPRDGDILLPTPVPNTAGVFTVAMEGTASDDVGVYGVIVTMYDPLGRATKYGASCGDLCSEKDETWTASIHVQLPGAYVAFATAVDSSGNLTPTPARVSFTML